MPETCLKTNENKVFRRPAGLDANHLCNLCQNRGQSGVAGIYSGNTVFVKRLFCGLSSGTPGDVTRMGGVVIGCGQYVKLGCPHGNGILDCEKVPCQCAEVSA